MAKQEVYFTRLTLYGGKGEHFPIYYCGITDSVFILRVGPYFLPCHGLGMAHGAPYRHGKAAFICTIFIVTISCIESRAAYMFMLSSLYNNVTLGQV